MEIGRIGTACRRRLAFVVLAVCGTLLTAMQPAAARSGPLDWTECEGGFECATLRVPRD